MPIMPGGHELRRRVELLRPAHRSALPAKQAEVLALLGLGCNEREVAELHGRSGSTVHNQVQAILSGVLSDMAARTTPTAAARAWLHSECCLASAFDAAQRDHPAVREKLLLLANAHAPELTPRQLEALVLQAFGLSDAERAAALFISSSTVRSTANQARALVVPPELAPSRQNASAWAHLHLCVLHRRPSQPSRFGEIWRKRLYA